VGALHGWTGEVRVMLRWGGENKNQSVDLMEEDETKTKKEMNIHAHIPETYIIIAGAEMKIHHIHVGLCGKAFHSTCVQHFIHVYSTNYKM
jgi:hypothetical protein